MLTYTFLKYLILLFLCNFCTTFKFYRCVQLNKEYKYTRFYEFLTQNFLTFALGLTQYLVKMV